MGEGLLSWTRTAPDDVETLEAPAWRPGDRFVYERGGRVRYEFVVTTSGEDGAVLTETGTGVETLFDGELRERGRRRQGSDTLVLRCQPFDARLHWPLWHGKKWSCDFWESGPDGLQHIRAHYHCDAVEELTTRAGVFRCFRIWRTVRLVAEREYYDRTQILWYAPEVGWFVRHLEGEMLVELVEFERQ